MYIIVNTFLKQNFVLVFTGVKQHRVKISLTSRYFGKSVREKWRDYWLGIMVIGIE